MSIREHILGDFKAAVANDKSFGKLPRIGIDAQVFFDVLKPAGEHILQNENMQEVYLSGFAEYLHDLVRESTMNVDGIQESRNIVLEALQSLEEQISISEDHDLDKVWVHGEASDLANNAGVFEHSAAFFRSISADDAAEMIEQVSNNVQRAHENNWIALPLHAPQTIDGFDQVDVQNDFEYDQHNAA